MPLLLTLDQTKKYDCCFVYDGEKQVWQIRFEERRITDDPSENKRSQHRTGDSSEEMGDEP
jgi:hypothetical protein